MRSGGSRRLETNRFALVDGDLVFDTTAPNGKGPQRRFDTTDTAGCTCEQIIKLQGLGHGHVKFGRSISAMQDWIESIAPWPGNGGGQRRPRRHRFDFRVGVAL